MYLLYEYATFDRKEQSLTGMVVASLSRDEQIPLKPKSLKASPREYLIVPERIDYDYVRSIMN